MEKINCGIFEIEKLSKEDIALYFEKAFNNPTVINMLNSSQSLMDADSNFVRFGNILQAYVTSTGDLSEETVSKLTTDFERNSYKIAHGDDKNKLEGMQLYFAEHVMPLVMSHHMNKLGLQGPLNFEQTAQILTSIKLNCRNNQFLTHSFNGALLDDIRNNGLDISKEKFKQEYDILSEVGLFQPYQKGNLLFCELSAASFGYAFAAPERLGMSLADSGRFEETLSLNENYTKSFQEKLSSKRLSEQQYGKVFSAGKKMIDFYFGDNNPKSAIAFKYSTETDEIKDAGSYCHSELVCMLMNHRAMLERKCSEANLPELKEEFKNALDDAQSSHNYQKIDNFIEKFNKHFPEDKTFAEILRVATIKAVTGSCLNNFMYNGNADGYIIKEGRLAPDKFSLAVFPNPIEQYVRHEKLAIAIEKEKMMAEEYNRELYERKYRMELISGRKPAESFEQYCENGFFNTYFLTSKDKSLALRGEKPEYRAWKEKKGYKDPNSVASKKLEAQVINKRKQNKAMQKQMQRNQLER